MKSGKNGYLFCSASARALGAPAEAAGTAGTCVGGWERGGLSAVRAGSCREM